MKYNNIFYDDNTILYVVFGGSGQILSRNPRISVRENFSKVHKLKNHISEHFLNLLTLE